MKAILKKSRNVGLALALGVAILAGISNMASAQTPNAPATADQAQPPVVQQVPAGTYAPAPGYYGPGYYGSGYAPGPQAYAPRGYAPGYGYGGWGCGWY
ncbi:hypothetical protein [Fundidesulfovibrio putealis]|uniref:hypothetical protein n=1 Tax=Fundidesulfovibrio putealis TaxID=270496 RepID=UPI0004295398|nr:hypothetical protein [Fundidesulfovibrio putealis]